LAHATHPDVAGAAVSRRRLITAVRERLRSSAARDTEESSRPVPATRARPRPSRPTPPDPHIEQLEAEAQYHRERFELHRARVLSGSPGATTLGRLRELERTATAAQERLAHARSAARAAGERERS
jgi:hypothetical protein